MSSYATYPTVPLGQVSAPGQIFYGLAITGIAFIVLFTVETLYSTSYDSAARFKTLIDYTAGAEDMSLTIHQNPNVYKDAIPLGLSVNERTGIEFAYSFYLYVYPQTFDGNASLKHVFHKGYTCPWPLMAPGVFLKGDTNTMRVIMNTYKNPYTYADIQNIPVQKWFHVVLNCYKGGLDIFVNGNLANRINFSDTLPYQNFEDIVLFSNANYSNFRGSTIPALGGDDFQINGSFKGYLSNLVYARYAMSVGEIQGLLAAGPSSKRKERVLDQPPYLADDWWANQGR